jgi:outer membrane biosynthesis protein TonB
MRTISLMILLLIGTGCSNGQIENKNMSEGIELVTPIEIQPKWENGSNQDLMKLIQSKIKYPSEECIEGTTVLQFKIDTIGNVIEPKIMRSISLNIDKQLTSEIVNYKFEPGSIMNRKSEFSMNFPFRIKLE